MFARWNSTHTPGCAVGVAQGGSTRFVRGYGMADLTNGIAIDPSTVLESGSVAKQFLSTAVLLLMQDGKLALDDDARKYIPELPVYSRPITLRHLLTHTSGLREWSNLVDWQGWPRGTRVYTQPFVFDIITRQKALNYPVGDFYSYTNSGFLLLRTIVERVSGQSFPEFTRARIFAPLGMTHTSWRDDFTRTVPRLAQAYSPRGAEWTLNMPFDNVIGAGGLLTTVEDWLTWNAALTSKKLGAAWGDSITRRMRLTNGTEIQYALGLIVTSYRGLREISHSGSTAGYSTFLARYPDRDNLSIAVLCNAAGAPATAHVHGIVDGLFADLPRAVAPDTIAGNSATLAKLAGVYRNTRTNVAVVFESAAGGARRAGGAAVRTMRDGTLLADGARLRLDTAADGRVRGYRQPTSDGDSVAFIRVADGVWRPAPGELAAFAGQYRNEEIGSTFTVAVSDGRLSVSPRAGAIEFLTPVYRETGSTGTREAFASGGDAIWFTRDARGRVTALHVGSARVWDMPFARV
ncbi:MAG TPA: serine hydrolase domain-containing protein, partial [Gemmatimonas sp.]|nr:serine hydrolase domain-containing protein [Gemmatimonas sp.]